MEPAPDRPGTVGEMARTARQEKVDVEAVLEWADERPWVEVWQWAITGIVELRCEVCDKQSTRISHFQKTHANCGFAVDSR